MKYWLAFFCILSFGSANADSSASIIPSGMQTPRNQKLDVVDYFNDGQQTGCGLRATGEASDDLWLNILVTIFHKRTGVTFGVIKVVARKAVTENGVPVLKNGEMTFIDQGRISKAWIESESGKQAMVYRNGQSRHSDAYMVNTEFDSTSDLLLAISQEPFKVGINRNGFGPDEIFQFHEPLDAAKVRKLLACINSLRAAQAENRSWDSF